MKTLKFLMLTVIAVCLVSCGGKKSSGDDTFEVTVDNTTIGGKLSQYFSLEEKTYKYKKGIIDEVTVELKCIEPLPENMKAYIGVDVLDKDGTVIAAGKPDAWSFDDYDVLRQATPGQIVTIKIENHNNVGEEEPAKIRLSSVLEEDSDSEGYSSVSTDDTSDDESSISSDDDEESSYSSSSSSSGSQDWDALLNSYEQYVDKYISYVKKAAKGDMSALAEYPSLMQKAQDFSEKMEGAQGEMSASQWARYMKITNKMTKAAAEMQ